MFMGPIKFDLLAATNQAVPILGRAHHRLSISEFYKKVI